MSNNSKITPVALLDSFMAARLGEAARGRRGTDDMDITIPNDPATRINTRRIPRNPNGVQTVDVTVRLEQDRMAGKKTPTRVVVEYDDHTVTLDGDQADALFWSQSACEKFLFPYYAAQYGVEYAYLMREEYFTRERTGVCHHPGSEICDPDRRLISTFELLTNAARALR